MANESKVILTERKSSHLSHLAKALQSLKDLDDYSTKPDGVWGSVATISCGNVTLKSSELDFEFTIPFDNNLEANEGEIIVYNLSDNTIKQLKNKASLSIVAGYEGDTGVIFKGYICKVSTTYEGADKLTKIKIIDDIGEKQTINISKSGGVKASEILYELLQKTGLPIGKFEIARDWTYENGVTGDESLEAAIKKYSEVCGVSTLTSNGKIYCCSLDKILDNLEFKVCEDTGMIGSPAPFEEESNVEDYVDVVNGYEIEMILQHRMSVGAKVRLDSLMYDGTYYVQSGEHTFNESECKTKIKVV